VKRYSYVKEMIFGTGKDSGRTCKFYLNSYFVGRGF
jgi:hypothetical protein